MHRKHPLALDSPRPQAAECATPSVGADPGSRLRLVGGAVIDIGPAANMGMLTFDDDKLVQYHASPKRWLQLFIYCCASFLCAMPWSIFVRPAHTQS